jgi:hypothetical protein
MRDAEVNATSIIAEAAKSIDAVKGAAAIDEGLLAEVLAHYQQYSTHKFGLPSTTWQDLRVSTETTTPLGGSAAGHAGCPPPIDATFSLAALQWGRGR